MARIRGMEIEALITSFAEQLSEDEHTSPRTAEFYEADLREFGRFLAAKDGSPTSRTSE